MQITYIIFGLGCGLVGVTPSLFHLERQGGRQIIYDRFDASCPGHDVPIIFEMQGVNMEGNKIRMNSTFTVKEDIIGDAKLLFVINRCKSKENLDSCELFHKLNSNKYCAMLDSGASLWGSFFSKFTPPYRCPIKKGVYRGINSEMDMSALMVLQSGNWYYRLNGDIRGKRTNRLLLCFFVDVSISSVSN